MTSSPAVLLIDNVDSFTFNVADLLHRVTGSAPTVWRHDHPVVPGSQWWRAFDAVILGPGPGRPSVATDMGLSLVALEQPGTPATHRVPVFGVCLGHQGIAHVAGHPVVQMTRPRHGIVSPVRHHGTGLFAGIPSPFPVVRYHSLALSPRFAPEADRGPQATAWAQDDDTVMALADPAARRWGVQFHPESVSTAYGEQLVRNFLTLAGIEPVPPIASTAQIPAPPAPSGMSNATVRTVRLATRRLLGPVPANALHTALSGLRPQGPQESVWLDSSDGVGVSILADPSGPLGYTLEHRVGQGARLSTGEHRPGPLLDTVAALLARVHLVSGARTHRAPLPFAFRPGFVGYFGYELKAETGGQARHAAPHPDAWLAFVDRAVVLEHSSGDVFAVALVDEDIRREQSAWLDRVEAEVERLRDPTATHASPSPAAGAGLIPGAGALSGARHTEAEYHALIGRAQQAIRAGESYEICVTNDVRWPELVDETRTYAAMRTLSPVPHGAWLRCGPLSVLSASPERFVCVSPAGKVRAEPIKGTRQRHQDPALDARAAEDLATDDKERAENLMIVDLLRNDLHRVCRSGSVAVPELFAVRSWAGVHQLVSVITGDLAPGLGPVDVLRSCFPGGSMTGAPKVRTMDILDELEGGPRGVYSGAIGWIGLNGAMDTSIVIRSVVLATTGIGAGRASFGVGGAITALSDPSAEYEETRVKAAGVAAALRTGSIQSG